MSKQKRKSFSQYRTETAKVDKRSVSTGELSSRLPLIAFCTTIFLSAFLLFLVQPMAAKMLLPLLGGAPAVWTTCMLFFQGMLLAGYFYAHLVSERLSFKTQVMVHIGVCALAFAVLPLGIGKIAILAGKIHPVLAVFGILGLCVGLPFFALSANAPLIQKWFSKTTSQDPYFLYGASNLGSLLALIGYPLVIESTLGLKLQSYIWSAGFVTLAAGIFVCSRFVKKDEQEQIQDDTQVASPPSLYERTKWVAIAAVPSSMMLGVTTHFATDIASLPLLWVVPLTFYLLSYIVAFSKWPLGMHKAVVGLLPAAVLTLLVLKFTHYHMGIMTLLGCHLGTFFIVALAFHGHLALTRPSAKYLTQFFLCTSLGGVIGGLFNGVIAPLAFKTDLEYSIALVAACILVPLSLLSKRTKPSTMGTLLADVGIPVVVAALTSWFLIRWPIPQALLSPFAAIFDTKASTAVYYANYIIPAWICAIVGYTSFRSVRFGGTVAAFVIATTFASGWEETVLYRDRSFFGILKVYNDPSFNARRLLNGTTLHGMQGLNPGMELEPLTYYHKQGPVGLIFEEFQGSDRNQNVASIGLGTGTLPIYSQPGENFTVYEIDKAVRQIATTQFTFLQNARGNVNIVMGDARLKLAEAPDHSYGLIVVDAFSSDSIPVHLLTREAFALYFQKLAPHGMVAIHISNRYLRLEPVVAMLAKDARVVAMVNNDGADNNTGKFASSWTLLARDTSDYGKLTSNQAWKKMEAFSWMPVWTDDFSSILSVLQY